MHVLNIIGDPSNKPTHGIAGKKCNRKALDMLKQPHPQIVHNHLTGIFHHHDLRNIENKVYDYDDKEDWRNKSNAGKIIFTQYCKIFFFQFGQVVKWYQGIRFIYLETVGIFIDDWFDFLDCYISL